MGRLIAERSATSEAIPLGMGAVASGRKHALQVPVTASLGGRDELLDGGARLLGGTFWLLGVGQKRAENVPTEPESPASNAAAPTSSADPATSNTNPATGTDSSSAQVS